MVPQVVKNTVRRGVAFDVAYDLMRIEGAVVLIEWIEEFAHGLVPAAVKAKTRYLALAAMLRREFLRLPFPAVNLLEVIRRADSPPPLAARARRRSGTLAKPARRAPAAAPTSREKATRPASSARPQTRTR